MEEKQLLANISYEANLNQSHQINLPEEFLKEIIENQTSHPFIFEIKTQFKKFYSSVLQFSADENTIEIPYLIANQFGIEENDILEIKFLSKVLFCKDLHIEPLTEIFFQLEKPDEFLEKKLSKFSLLYLNQIFYVTDDNDITYPIKVNKIEPDFDTINFSDFNEDNQSCFIITNQDVNLFILNQFEIDRYYEEKRKKRHEMLVQEAEIKKMKKEDFNILKLGVKLGGTRQIKSIDDIRQARIEKYKQSSTKKK